MREKLLKKINKDLKHKKLYILCSEIGIPYATMWRLTNGLGDTVKMRTWEKIDEYYKKSA